jgi:hypothetical protein
MEDDLELPIARLVYGQLYPVLVEQLTVCTASLTKHLEHECNRVAHALVRIDPAFAQTAAAVSSLAPAGTELRRKPRELASRGRPAWSSEAPMD